MKNKSDARYYKKAIIQIGLLFLGIIVVALIGLAILIYNGSSRLYLEGKNEIITQNLIKINNSLEGMTHLSWTLDYLEKHSDEIGSHHLESKYLADDSEDVCYAAGHYGEFSDEQLDALPENEKFEVACVLYNNMIITMFEHGVFYDFNDCYLLDIGDENRGFIFYESGFVPHDNNYYSLGSVWGYADDEHPVLRKYSSGESDGIEFEIVKNIRFDGKSYYIGYLPIPARDGTLKYAIALSYEWSDFEKTLKSNVNNSLIIGTGLGLITACLLMLFVYSIVVKPLGIVSTSVRDYTDNKDSNKVTDTLAAVRSRNEVGQLAKDISTMTEEIDRYTREITALATERERVAAELELASKIQMSMLPREFPEESCYSLFATMTPAKEVGGDFYDFFMIDEKHLGIVIADVSGKGIPAALFMAVSKMRIRNSAGPHISPAKTLALANSALVADNENEMFVTVWYGILNLNTGHLRAANAGHEYPMIRTAGGDFEILKDKHSMVLGALPNLKTFDYELTLSKGDTLFVYTDGAPEATDGNGEMFGTDRLAEALNKDPGAEPSALIDSVKTSISEFVGDADQFDDLTMLCIRYDGKS